MKLAFENLIRVSSLLTPAFARNLSCGPSLLLLPYPREFRASLAAEVPNLSLKSLKFNAVFADSDRGPTH